MKNTTINVRKFFNKYLKDYKEQSGGRELYINCLFCSPVDHKYHLAVNAKTGLFHCWKCGEKGNFFSLVTELFRNKPLRFDINDYTTIDNKKKVSTINKVIEYPEGFYPFTGKENRWGKQALNYLLNRGLTLADVIYYKIGYCNIGKYSGRVIVPIFNTTNDLVSFIARDYTGNLKPKVLTPPGEGGSGIKNYVFNLTNASKTRHLVIAEGVFDAIALGPRGIAIFGKEATPQQLSLIINSKPERITIALDPDARKEALRLAKTLSFNIDDIRIMNFHGEKDPGELDKTTAEVYIRDAAVFTSPLEL